MSEDIFSEMPRLQHLAEFRFQLRKFLSFSESATERCGISAQQYQLMQVIGALKPGQRASISYIAERMILRHNSTVELVDRGERAGIVRREIDESDLRRSIVHLTPEGLKLLEKLVAEHLEELADRGKDIVQALHRLNESAVTADSPQAEAASADASSS